MEPGRDGALADRGVSPVIGVVLMVGLTVLVTSVTAVALYDVFTETLADVSAGPMVTVDEGDENGITVTWVSNTQPDKLRVEFTAGDDHAVGFLRHVGASVTLGPGGFELVGGSTVPGSGFTVNQGDVVLLTVTAQDGDHRILVARRTVTV